jgi:hypothetical protein
LPVVDGDGRKNGCNFLSPENEKIEVQCEKHDPYTAQ